MTTPMLQALDLTVEIGGTPVLHNITVSFIPGAVTAIVGPNGAGKSTLLETLAGVRAATRGAVARAGSTALVVQRVEAPAALPITVGEVVMMGTWGGGNGGRRHGVREGAALRHERVAVALDRVALSDIATKPFASLSGGQRQRALLAQGLARQAEIFLLDEPAAGLDADSRDRMQGVLSREAARGAVVVCVTHDSEAIAAAHHTLVVESGAAVMR